MLNVTKPRAVQSSQKIAHNSIWYLEKFRWLSPWDRKHSLFGCLSVTMAQIGLLDLSKCYENLDSKRDPPVEINAIVPCKKFRPALERASR